MPAKSNTKAQPAQLSGANAGQEEVAALNRQKAFDLRCQRRTYREISDALGVSVSTAHAYVEEHWTKIESATSEKAAMLRAIELAQLDSMEARWLPLALHPALDVSTFKGEAHIELPAYDAGLKAVDRVIKIHERRAKLLGLDMPAKVEHSGAVGTRHMLRSEWKKRIEEARA